MSVTLTGGRATSVTSVARQPAYEIAPGVWRIPVMTDDAINAFAFVADDGQVTLLDGGLPYTRHRVRRGLTHLGSDVSPGHPDHRHARAQRPRRRARLGRRGSPARRWWRTSSTRRTCARGACRRSARRPAAAAVLEVLGRYPKVAVTTTVADGESIDGRACAPSTPPATRRGTRRGCTSRAARSSPATPCTSTRARCASASRSTATTSRSTSAAPRGSASSTTTPSASRTARRSAAAVAPRCAPSWPPARPA